MTAANECNEPQPINIYNINCMIISVLSLDEFGNTI